MRTLDWKPIAARCAMLAAAGALRARPATAADLLIRVDNPPTNGTVIAMLFNSADTFAGLRNPLKVVTLPSGGATPGRMTDLPPGDYALAVYCDEDGDGALDENFVGIPREPLGFSNRYWPQGPPSFTRAAFRLDAGETKACDIRLQSVFGKRGLLGAGAGVIARTSPYRGARHVIVQPIPVISYIGDRVQILGPAANCGIVNRGGTALAATASYRFGAYAEDDSPHLQGLGDRDDTLMGGVALQAKLPAGFDLSVGYEHDLLSRTDGGNGRVGIDRAFQRGLLTVSPQLALNWLTAELAGYEYGVPPDRAGEGRPAYRPGDAVTFDMGGAAFVELRGAWRIILSGRVTVLPSELTDSPIVGESHVLGGFAAVTRLF